MLNVTNDDADKTELLKEQLHELVGNPDVCINVTILGEGLNSVTVAIQLRYQADIEESRLPAYILNGERFSAVYSLDGDSFTMDAVTLPYTIFEGSIMLNSPYDGEQKVVISSPYIRNVFSAPLDRLYDPYFGYLQGENCNPIPVTLEWNDTDATQGKEYTVLISEHNDFAEAMVFTTTDRWIEIHNLLMDTAYFWKVSDGEQESQTFTFRTEGQITRFIAVEGVSNFRDIGGYLTVDGKRVKQGLVFRSAALDAITEQGKDLMIHSLGIKTELDLRGGGVAALGLEVRREVIAMQWFEHIFKPENYEVVRKTVAAFAVEENYPINFHCSVGRDRTGTTEFLILGLLGVKEELLIRDYFCSFFSEAGSVPANEISLHTPNIDGLVKGIKSYGKSGSTLQEHIGQYLLAIGITRMEMELIRYNLLEDYTIVIPDETEPEDPPQDPVDTTVTEDGRVTFDMIEVVSIAQPYEITKYVIKVRSYNTVLSLGAVDLTKYSKVRITYGSDHRAQLGDAGSFYALTSGPAPVNNTDSVGVIAWGMMKNAAGSAWTPDRTTIIDLSSVEYADCVYLSIYMGDSNGMDIFSIEFIE